MADLTAQEESVASSNKRKLGAVENETQGLPGLAAEEGIPVPGPTESLRLKKWRKTKMCTFFQINQCHKGSECTFAHGEWEMGQEFDATPLTDRATGSSYGVISPGQKGCTSGSGKDAGKGKDKDKGRGEIGFDKGGAAYHKGGAGGKACGKMDFKGGGKADMSSMPVAWLENRRGGKADASGMPVAWPDSRGGGKADVRSMPVALPDGNGDGKADMSSPPVALLEGKGGGNADMSSLPADVASLMMQAFGETGGYGDYATAVDGTGIAGNAGNAGCVDGTGAMGTGAMGAMDGMAFLAGGSMASGGLTVPAATVSTTPEGAMAAAMAETAAAEAAAATVAAGGSTAEAAAMAEFMASLAAQQGIVATATSVEGVPYDGFKYKTQPCKFYSLGKCQKGETCTYAHFEQELTATPPPRGKGAHTTGPLDVEAQGQKGKSKDPASQFAAMVFAAQAVPGGKGKDFKARKPGKGGGHTFKTIPCKFFPIGQCSKGEACTFAHSSGDLRPSKQSGTGGTGPGPNAALEAALRAVKDGQATFAQWDAPP